MPGAPTPTPPEWSAFCTRHWTHQSITRVSENARDNYVNPDDNVGAVSYVTGYEENVSGNLETVNLRTIAIKNLDVARDLAATGLPLDLLTRPDKCRPGAPLQERGVLCLNNGPASQ